MAVPRQTLNQPLNHPRQLTFVISDQLIQMQKFQRKMPKSQFPSNSSQRLRRHIPPILDALLNRHIMLHSEVLLHLGHLEFQKPDQLIILLELVIVVNWNSY